MLIESSKSEITQHKPTITDINQLIDIIRMSLSELIRCSGSVGKYATEAAKLIAKKDIKITLLPNPLPQSVFKEISLIKDLNEIEDLIKSHKNLKRYKVLIDQLIKLNMPYEGIARVVSDYSKNIYTTLSNTNSYITPEVSFPNNIKLSNPFLKVEFERDLISSLVFAIELKKYIDPMERPEKELNLQQMSSFQKKANYAEYEYLIHQMHIDPKDFTDYQKTLVEQFEN